MDKNGDINHFSDEEITLYCKRELSHEDMSRLTKHIEDCDSCKKTVAEAQTFSELMCQAIEADLSNERKKDCLSEMDISAYFERQATAEEKMHIEEHLSKCNYCLSLLVETEKSLKEGKKEVLTFSDEKIMGAVLKQLRGKREEVLAGKLAELFKNSPVTVRNALEGIKNDIELMFKNTFAFPSPRFAPVFGEHPVVVLSPFGKIRYPVIFEWMPYEGADHYTISVEDTAWSFTTKETKIEANPEELKLDYGKEYMWEMKVMKGKEVIDEITGFFAFVGENEQKELEEIEKQLKGVEPETDRLILWGGILEEKGFYMEAIEEYNNAYDLDPVGGIAYRIAYCYERLELEELRDEWNRKIKE